jgi:hypothetical protein
MVINRECQKKGNAETITIATTVVAGNAIPYGSYAGGMLYVPSGAGYTVITWYVSADGVNFYPIDYGGGTNTTTTVAASFAYPFPSSAFGAPYILPVATTGSAGTAQFTLKS